MSSGATSSVLASSKITPQSSSANYSQTPSNTNTDSGSKRSNSSGSFGAGVLTRQTSQPRSNQPLRKQNKAQRRARLADDDALAEANAMKSINSRKGQTSITHLMNFSLPPRPHYQPQHYGSNHRYQRRNPTWGLGSGYHAVDKARYIHANYRFIVRPDREYHAQSVDADVYLSWDAVLQILASAATQSTSCPICLSPPTAARMAKCGHIFCLPCLIRYMHSTDDNNPVPEKRSRWKKCPICEDSIYISEVRPVRWFVGQEASLLREGGDVLLRLLMREPGSALALPRDAAENYGRHEDVPWYYVAEMMDYARVMKGSEDYMREQYDSEVAAIEELERVDELMFGDENTWTRKAVAAVEDAKQKLVGIGNPPTTENPTSTNGHQIPQRWEDELEDPHESQLSQAVKDMNIALSPARDRSSITSHSSSGKRAPNQPMYFYHALPNFFLSALDIRILRTAFGDFSSFPSTILPRVEHISTGHVIDDDLRKRAKYMAHLPYGCEVTFLECDWTDIISPVILDQFRDDIQRRRKRNQDKEAREERDRIRAEREEDEKKWAMARRKRPSTISKSFSEADFQPLIHADMAVESSPTSSTLAGTPPWANQRAQSSFATLVTPGTSPDAARTVWGTAAIAPLSPALIASPDPAPPADDGWLQDWEKDLLDEGQVAAAIEASINGESRARSVPNNGGGRKGKKKKITLMSTGARRGA